MPIDRDDTLRRAEKLLRQGRLEAAIAEYGRIVTEYPRDWATANLLGDLYVRAGDVVRASEQYARVAEHLAQDGFVAKAAALYKKIIKLTPADENALLRSAELAAGQGLTADVRTYMNALFHLRIKRGDRDGVLTLAARRVSFDPSDIVGRLDAARMLAEAGHAAGAAAELHQAGLTLRDLGRLPEATRALREALRLDAANDDARAAFIDLCIAQNDVSALMDHAATPAQYRMLAARCRAAGLAQPARVALERLIEADPGDAEARVLLARACLEADDVAGAADWVSADGLPATSDLALVKSEVCLRQGRLEDAGTLLTGALARDSSLAQPMADLAMRLAGRDAEAATAAVLPVVDAACGRGDLAQARHLLEALVAEAPGAVTALRRLIEVNVDGGFDEELRDTQVRLTDALLAREAWEEARAVAEDLVAADPTDALHAGRLRRALAALGIDDGTADATSDALPDVDPPEDDPAAVGLLSEDFSDLVAVLSAEAGRGKADQQPGGTSPPVRGDAERGGADHVIVDENLRRLFEDAESPAADADRPGVFEVDLSIALEDLLAQEPPPVAPSSDPSPATSSEAPAGDLDGFFQDLRGGAAAEARAEEALRLLADGDACYAEGRLDDAVEALREAARDPHARLQASRLIARIARERGDLAEAVDWLERAAEAPAPTTETWQELLYELAEALEAEGESVRALAVLLELQTATPGYRDVEARISGLSARPGGAAPAGTGRHP